MSGIENGSSSRPERSGHSSPEASRSGETAPEEPWFETSADQAWFKAVERRFIELRGRPLQLSGDDWQVCREWRRRGIPLDVVTSVLEDVVARQREAEKEVVAKLRYYRRAVNAAWKRREELAAPAAPVPVKGLDVAARLRALASALPPAETFEALRREIAELDGDAEAVEAELTRLDRRLLEAAEEALDDDGRAAVAQRLAASLQALAGRLPAEEVDAARRRLRQQVLRRRLGLPVLSLFSPEAAAGEGE